MSEYLVPEALPLLPRFYSVYLAHSCGYVAKASGRWHVLGSATGWSSMPSALLALFSFRIMHMKVAVACLGKSSALYAISGTGDTMYLGLDLHGAERRYCSLSAFT